MPSTTDQYAIDLLLEEGGSQSDFVLVEDDLGHGAAGCKSSKPISVESYLRL